MYAEKVKPILEDIENKKVEIAGGSVVGIVLSTTNSLVKYIANLTIGKKNYENVEEDVKKVLIKADELKNASLSVIDEDKEVLEKILDAYKTRKDDEEKYQDACKKGTDFCMKVLNIANDTFNLAEDISKIGNRMLSSDFMICKNYAIASIHSAAENVYTNVKFVNDEQYRNRIETECNNILGGIKV